MIIRGIKSIADTIIHGYAKRSLCGWFLHTLGAFWDTITNLLLHLDINRPTGSPVESHGLLLTPSATQNSMMAPETLTKNAKYQFR